MYHGKPFQMDSRFSENGFTVSSLSVTLTHDFIFHVVLIIYESLIASTKREHNKKENGESNVSGKIEIRIQKNNPDFANFRYWYRQIPFFTYILVVCMSVRLLFSFVFCGQLSKKYSCWKIHVSPCVCMAEAVVATARGISESQNCQKSS